MVEPASSGRTRSEVWLHSVADGSSTRILMGDAWFDYPRFSPDRQWLAYVSDESGRREVYVRPISGAGERSQLSLDGGTEPHWRADGGEIVFRTPAGAIMAVGVTAGTSFDAGVPRRLFTLPADALWDAVADHSRFLVTGGVSEGQTTPVSVVLGWAAEQGRSGAK